MGIIETTKTFIEKAKKVHGEKYDYSLVDYVRSSEKVKIICSEHNIFEQRPNDHLKGKGCRFCGNNVNLTTEQFIKDANKVHGDGYYDYSKSVYVNAKTNLIIICPRHNFEFDCSPDNHKRGKGCSKCGNSYKKTNDDFIELAKEKHGDKFDYSKTVFTKNTDDVIIICKEHGDFKQKASAHLRNNDACEECKKYKNSLTHEKIIPSKEEIITSFIEKHADKFDYSKVDYINPDTNVIIICKKHGEFIQTPKSHIMSKRCCQKCKDEHLRETFGLTWEEIKVRINESHPNNKYIYDLERIKYNNTDDKIVITCPDHGDFEMTIRYHINGGICPDCVDTTSSIGEYKIDYLLKQNNIIFIKQKKFEECKHINHLLFDFYIPKINTIIEYNGEQHYKPIKIFGGESQFQLIKHRDSIKKQYCLDNNIRLVIIRYDEDIYPRLKEEGIVTV